MKKQTSLLIGIFLITASIALILWWLNVSKASTDDINIASKPITTVNPKVFSQQTFDLFQDKNIYGGVPLSTQDNYANQELF